MGIWRCRRQAGSGYLEVQEASRLQWVSGGAGGTEAGSGYLEVQEASRQWASGGAGGKQAVGIWRCTTAKFHCDDPFQTARAPAFHR